MLAKLYRWYGKKTVLGALGVIGMLAIAGISLSVFGGDAAEPPEQRASQMVRTAPVAELAARGSSVSIIGTVEAISEAEVRAETSGRVTSVRVAIGDRVAAGTVLATFANSSERASLLQAEGAYEAAAASAAQSDVSAGASANDLASARTAAWNTYRSAFIAADTVMRTTLDDLFVSYNRQVLLLDEYTWERRLIRYELEEWGEQSRAPLPENTVATRLDAATARIDRMTAFIDAVYERLTRIERSTDNSDTLAIITTYKTELSTARSTLNSARTSLTSALAELARAQAARERAEIGGTGSENSLADAQVKQALGTLRAAQAAFERTIVRAPIAGTVNAVYVKQGAYVPTASPVAEVVNTGALTITAFLSEADRSRVALGDTLAVEGGYEGTVTRIAPSRNAATQRYEVTISPNTTELANGDVVRIALSGDRAAASENEETPIFLPLTAVKLTADGAVVFSVADGALVAHEVTIGDVRGSSIAVLEGVTPTMEIVTDARGLAAGMEVGIVDEN